MTLYSISVFSFSNFRITIPKFRCSFFDTFNFSFPNCHCSIFDFTVSVHFFFNCWVGLSKFRFTYDWHFQFTRPIFLTFSNFRFQNYSFLVFDFPISNIRLQIGSFQLQIVILEFAFYFCSDVRCQMLQNGWLLRMGSTHLATGMVLG
jgi:hypothetical protein